MSLIICNESENFVCVEKDHFIYLIKINSNCGIYKSKENDFNSDRSSWIIEVSINETISLIKIRVKK